MRYTLHHGDCLPFLTSLPDASVDAVITDPPYASGGVSTASRLRTTSAKYISKESGSLHLPDFAGDAKDQRSWTFWATCFLSEALRVARPGAVLFAFIDWRQLPAMSDAVQAAGWTWRGIVPWDKTERSRPQKGWFRAQCEYVVTAAKGTPARYDLRGQSDAPCLEGIARCAIDRERLHQTQKPVDLLAWLLQAVRPGGTVLDPFMGAGSTGVACARTGHAFIGCEVSAEIFATAQDRVATAYGQVAA